VNQVGRFNMANALGVLGCLIAHGLPSKSGGMLRRCRRSGRMQQVGDEPLVVVDYAHTPDALEKVLQALRPVAAQRGGRLVACSARRRPRSAKRAPMGAVVSRLADRAVVTSDNPRSEDPLKIIQAIRPGSPATAKSSRTGRRRSQRRFAAHGCRRRADCRQGPRETTRRSPAAPRVLDVAVARDALRRRGRA
jgi:UDP-N-acetylmuramoyl-L-alanyl-D-glutamate--2,6-diaminopimelate ligase